MANLFSKAKKAAPKTKSAKDEKVRITVSDPTFFDKIEKLEMLNDQLKSAAAKADMISDEIKDIAKSEWVKLYEKNKKNPGTVMLESIKDEDVAQFMFVPSDKYITINKDRAEDLRETFGETVVEEKTIFSFDPEMIDKYGEILSRLIEESDEIDSKDKEKIIIAKETYSVAKGSINNFADLGDVQVVMESLRPVISIKNVEVIKG